jgi:hypothetical protein
MVTFAIIVTTVASLCTILDWIERHIGSRAKRS